MRESARSKRNRVRILDNRGATSTTMVIVVALAVALVVAGYSLVRLNRATAPVAGLKIGLLPITDALPFFVAEQKGYFAAEKVQVELVNFKSALERDAAIQAGQTDGQVAELIASAALLAGGTPVKVGSISLGVTPEEGRMAILSSPKSNITKVDDLKGVEIAVSPNSIIEYTVDRMLTLKGFTAAQIKKSVIPAIPVRLQMLMADQIKATALPDPLATLAQNQGAHLIIDDSKGENISQSVILLRQDAVDKKTTSVERMFKAYNKAVADINANPNAYRDLLVAKAGLPGPLKGSYKVDPFSTAQVPTKGQVQKVVDWMVAKKLISSPVSYDQLVTTKFAPTTTGTGK